MTGYVIKRDGKKATFDCCRITKAVEKAFKASKEVNSPQAAAWRVTAMVLKWLDEEGKDTVHLEHIQDLVIRALHTLGYHQTEIRYAIYRHMHQQARVSRAGLLDVNDVIENYIKDHDWRVWENANIGFGFGGLLLHSAGAMIANYVLNYIYPEEIANAHREGFFHIHDLSMGITGYCCGHSLRQLLLEGFGGVTGKTSAMPPKHFGSALLQMVNYIGTLQNEWAGAQAFNNVDTLLAPYIRADKLSYEEVKQEIQQFVFNLNVTSRWGGQCVDEATLCLTPAGWRRYSDLKVGDTIYVFDLATKKIKEDAVKAVNLYEYDGDMLLFEGRKLSFLVTPNHKIVRRVFHGNKYLLEDADAVYRHKTPVIIPLAAEVDRPDYEKFTDDEIRLMAWFLSDACMEKNKNRIRIYQSPKKYADRIRGLLNRLGIRFTESKDYGQWSGENRVFNIYGETAAKWRAYTKCNRNKIPEDFLRNASARQFRIFIEEYALADGCFERRGRIRIAKKNEEMANDLLYVYTLAGIAAKREYRKQSTPVVTSYKRKHASMIRIRKVHYKGKVWCPTTDTGTFIAKRNGHVFITGNSPFTNITLDFTIPEYLKKEAAIGPGGKTLDATYGDYQKEVDMINRAFLEVMLEGDAQGRIFPFPIPTYNITRDFNWDSENTKLLFEITAKYGIPYFQNFINSVLKPQDVRSMCCRLNMNLKELRHKTGGLFASGDTTGSIGVVTLNLPRLAYLAKKNGEEFFALIEQYMELAKNSLEIKRKLLERNLERGLFPFTKRYLPRGFSTFFSTIGLIGMNEACLNLTGEDISAEEGQKLAIATLSFMRERLKQFQQETGHLYNLEATPAEGTSFRLAKIDKKDFPDIQTAGTDNSPYYTNSTQLPVNYTDDLVSALEHQEPLQCLYTGGTVFHCFLGERLPDTTTCKLLVKKILSNFRFPYLSITPTFSICPQHGYLSGEHFQCPQCGEECEVYSRVVGYYRPVKNWNKGKKQEFKERKTFRV